ncbi:MAG: TetR/AcrR family transcriptional regulator [Flaviflexus sp.]|uniref:TetR/AcrR family transcriptional regulator n=1 Tax=Flaviflexus sp. TaxID=1969482 RepID=UPI00352C6564
MSTEERPYHHGNLRAELIRVGLELANEGGTRAVGLREAARRIGVSPSAAYRHFSGHADLLLAVRNEIIHIIEVEFTEALLTVDENDVVGRLRALADIYFSFAVDHTMQFDVFASVFPEHEDWLGHSGEPIQILIDVMKKVKPESDDPAGESVAVWAPLHGISILCTLGALRAIPLEDKWKAQESVVVLILRGLKLID